MSGLPFIYLFTFDWVQTTCLSGVGKRCSCADEMQKVANGIRKAHSCFHRYVKLQDPRRWGCTSVFFCWTLFAVNKIDDCNTMPCLGQWCRGFGTLQKLVSKCYSFVMTWLPVGGLSSASSTKELCHSAVFLTRSCATRGPKRGRKTPERAIFVAFCVIVPNPEPRRDHRAESPQRRTPKIGLSKRTSRQLY